jgi:perosamine synthetase
MNESRFPERIPIAGPWVTDHEVDMVAAAARESWYEDAGSYTQRFEQTFADYVGRRHALALPSCTSAIHLTLAALGIGPGDEVVVPDATWIASSAPIDYVGATPVFADIDPVTWCLSAGSLEAVITDATRAVLVVDLYGGMPDMDRILAIADRRGIAVIEDAAEAVGSKVGDRKAGSFGTTSVFSFHGSKTVTTGEGGMVLTDDGVLQDRMAVLRDHGRVPGDTTFFNREVAYKYRMSDLQAAFGLAQVQRVDELVSRKRQIFSWYRQRLEGSPGIALNAEPEGITNSYWMVTVVLDVDCGITKEELGRRMLELNIDTRPFFHPLSSLPAYSEHSQAKVARERNVVSYRVCPVGVNLPSALNLTEPQVEFVCDALLRIVGERSG